MMKAKQVATAISEKLNSTKIRRLSHLKKETYNFTAGSGFEVDVWQETEQLVMVDIDNYIGELPTAKTVATEGDIEGFLKLFEALEAECLNS